MAATTKPKRVFKSRDDEDHDSEAAAKARNALLDAKEAFEKALQNVHRAFKDHAKTADGEPFTAGKTTFWFIYPCYGGGLPSLERVTIWPYHCSLDLDYADGALIVYEYCAERKDYRRFRISELYADERKAKEALLKACDERMGSLTDEVSELRAGKQRGQW